MRRRRVVEAAQGLPPIPGDGQKRDQQVKIRLSVSEVERLKALRPDLTTAGVVALIVDDVLAGRHRPGWAADAK
ncbi:hypothetical protein [Actinoplanes sp. NPDC089786]|uniref:hypothetical protein n=1 Tax=Actinoplanes sp. NPDC089786 TaxID=3155185 RepID=UPI00342CC0A7